MPIPPRNREKINKKVLIDTLHKTGGIVLRTAKAMGITVPAIYRYMERHPEVKAELDKAREQIVDLAEEALADLIQDRNPQAVMFALKCQGAARKWQEKTVVEASLSINKPDDMAIALGLPSATSATSTTPTESEG